MRIDAGANLIGRMDGAERDARTIMLGSHSDTVPSGGRFDGPAGILAALEVVRVHENGWARPRHSIEVVDFLAEEPSEYGVSCVGSRAMAGALDHKLLTYTNAEGEKLSDAHAASAAIPTGLSRRGAPTSLDISSCISSRATFSRTIGSTSAW